MAFADRRKEDPRIKAALLRTPLAFIKGVSP
jgi:hypothetical protein